MEKTFATLVQEVEAALGSPPNATFSKMKRDSWGFMNSLTHTGFQHIVRRNSETATGPNYPQGEVVHLANAAGALGLFMALELAALGKHLALAELTLERCQDFAKS
jgi:hypothetical protein